MTPPKPNNPGYTPEYKELVEARKNASWLSTQGEGTIDPRVLAVRWLAAEVRVMRLERALEQ